MTSPTLPVASVAVLRRKKAIVVWGEDRHAAVKLEHQCHHGRNCGPELLGREARVEYDPKMGRGRVDFDRGIVRLTSYARYHGHANPKSDEIWLDWKIGLWVSSLREKYRSDKLTSQQITEAEAIGVRFKPPYRVPKPKLPSRAERRESELLERLGRLHDFYRRHGHINVPQLIGIEEWPGAGRWIARFRGQYRRGMLTDAIIQTAERMNIDWNPGPGSQRHRLPKQETHVAAPIRRALYQSVETRSRR